jgi:hypothetical protein
MNENNRHHCGIPLFKKKFFLFQGSIASSFLTLAIRTPVFFCFFLKNTSAIHLHFILAKTVFAIQSFEETNTTMLGSKLKNFDHNFI